MQPQFAQTLTFICSTAYHAANSCVEYTVTLFLLYTGPVVIINWCCIHNATKENGMQSTLFFRKVMMLGLVCTMSSCVRYYDVIKTEFNQGKKEPSKGCVAQAYRRATTVYDEFETRAHFDVVWLSDNIRCTYVDVYSNKRNLDLNTKEQMLKRQLEENKHWASFYVLADVREKTNASLSDPASVWTLSLQIDDQKPLQPESIKEVTLEPEMQMFFGSTFNLFKTAFLVKIPVTAEIADQLARYRFDSVRLYFRSPYKETSLVWDKCDVLNNKKVVHEKDYYWC